MSVQSTSLKKAVISAVSSLLERQHFLRKKRSVVFLRRRSSNVAEYVFLNIYDEVEKWRIAPVIGVRFEDVETCLQTACNCFGSDVDRQTVITELAALQPKSLVNRYLTYRESGAGGTVIQRKAAIPVFMQDLEENLARCARPYYDQCSELNNVDELLNRRPEEPTMYKDSLTRCFTGTIVASMCNRPKLAGLVLTYTQSLRRQASGFYVPEYLKLLEYLGC
jgi:hypothetical protein